jgi:D-sedoheptulose 7-phosphate isomerase
MSQTLKRAIPMTTPPNEVDKLFSSSASFQQFASGYFDYLSKLMKAMDLDVIASLVRELESARDEGRTVFVIGNGGSAATASHMANDFSVGATRAGQDDRAFRVVALTDNVSLMTAVANDLGYDQVFTAQLRSQFVKGDRLIAITASGNSPNLLEAATYVKQNGGKVIGLVGFDGGRLKDLSDIVIHVKTAKGEYGPVEDIHMILDHVIYSWIRQTVLKGNKRPSLA